MPIVSCYKSGGDSSRAILTPFAFPTCVLPVPQIGISQDHSRSKISTHDCGVMSSKYSSIALPISLTRSAGISAVAPTRRSSALRAFGASSCATLSMISRDFPRWLIETGFCKALAMISPDLRDKSLVENVRAILSFIENYEYSNDGNGVDCPLGDGCLIGAMTKIKVICPSRQ